MVHAGLTGMRRRNPDRQEGSGSGFTRTELLVLVGVVAVFSVALAADLTQTRAKLLQQACAANMKQWGLAFDLYSQDYNGTFFYDSGGTHFDNTSGPYMPYLNHVSDNIVAVRIMRVCPAIAAGVAQAPVDLTQVHDYQMPIGTYRKGLVYANADTSGSPYYGNTGAPYWPHLKYCPNPSQHLMLIECSGNTLYCGGLVYSVINLHSRLPPSPAVEAIPAIGRHGGMINCLFGDFHVESVSLQALSNQDAIGCNIPSGNPWFTLD
jgi:prepilin-type processing-associated H-X9-DG protein